MENNDITSRSSQVLPQVGFTISQEPKTESASADKKVLADQNTGSIAKKSLLKDSEAVSKKNHIVTKSISSAKLPAVKKADHEFTKDFPTVVSSNKSKLPSLSLNLEADHIQQKVKDQEKGRKFIELVKSNANSLINDKDFSSKKYSSSTSTYANAASDCRKAAKMLTELSTGKDNEAIMALEEMALSFDKAVENIDKKAKSLNGESKILLSKIAKEDILKSTAIENNEVSEARNLYKPGFEKQEIPKGSDAEGLIILSRKCIEESKNPNISTKERNNLRMNGHMLAEKGARIRTEKNKSEEALQVRSELLKSLGPPSLTENTQLSDVLTEKNSSVYGAFAHNLSSGTVKGGNINFDQRTISTNGQESQITAITMTMNYHVRENIQDTLKMEKEAIIKSLVSTYPELEGKITITNENQVFRQFIDKKNKVYDGNASNGKILGRNWTLNIEGVGKLSIPITPEIKMEGKVDHKGRPIGTYAAADQEHVVFVPHLANTNKTQGYAPSNTTILHDIYLEMDGTISAEDKLKYSQGMLTMVGAGPVFEKDGSEIEEKAKMLEAFHAFFPSQALKLKIEASTYNLTAEELGKKINESIVEMDKKVVADFQKNAQTEHANYYKQTISSHAAGVKGYREALSGNKVTEFISMNGRKEYSVSNRAEVVKECSEKAGNPIWGFYAGSGGSPWEKDVNNRYVLDDKGNKVPAKLTEKNINTAILMLRGGLQSTHSLINQGIFPAGDSPAEDLANGAGKGVYLRPAGDSFKKMLANDATLAGVYKVRVGMGVLNKQARTLNYKVDAYGANAPINETHYLRDKGGVSENAVFQMEPTAQFYSSLREFEFKASEVIVEDMLDPEDIVGITVSTEENRLLMREGLLNSGLFVNESFNGVHIDTLLTCSDKFTKDNWPA